MTEQLITFETAKLAKEKGFDIPCWNFFSKEDKEEDIMNWVGVNFKQKLSVARKFVRYWKPTQSYLQQYLREVHKINVFVHMDSIFKKDTYMFSVLKFDNVYWNHVSSKNGEFNGFTSYEEALEKGLQKALKLI